MSDYLYFPSNLKDIKDHILDYIKVAKSFHNKKEQFPKKT